MHSGVPLPYKNLQLAAALATLTMHKVLLMNSSSIVLYI